MPIFEYMCEECEKTFERLTLQPQSGAQPPCPQCGSVQTTKVFSTFSTQASAAGGAPGYTGSSAFR
jgi:putative FmdB family regulatory protein